MLNFDYLIPTKVLFGKGRISDLADEIKIHAKKVLLVYGKSSIKKTGLYDEITKVLNDANIEFKELSGIDPNPRLSKVKEGIKLCKEHRLDFILAAGGGSVIDTAKSIAAGYFYDGDIWDLFLQKGDIDKALPVGAILTLAATGSESNGNAVITNEETEQKLAIRMPILRPVFSILDPVYTFSVPKKHTAAGTVDIMSHIFEQYFSLERDSYAQDRLCEGLLKTCIEYGPIAMREPENYEARANLMWAGHLALNGILTLGKTTDWATHRIEHEVSAIYDVTHGVGLAILTPYWMEYVLNDATKSKFTEYAKNVWNLCGEDEMLLAKEAIQKTRKFFNSIGMPSTLREVGVEENRLEEMAQKALLFGELGIFKKLSKEDILSILKLAY